MKPSSVLLRRNGSGGGGGTGVPDTINGLTVWLDFSDSSTLFQDTAGSSPVTSDGQNLKRANNKAGGNPFTEATLNPIFKTALVNGKSGARFTYAGFALHRLAGDAASNYITNSAMTIMIVAKVSGVTANSGSTYSNARLIGDGPGDYFGIYAATSPDRLMAYNWDGSDDHADNLESQGSFAVIQMRHRAGNIEIRVNSDSWATTASGNTQNISGLMQLGISSTGSCDYIHAVVYDESISDTDADLLRDWALSEIGL